MDDSEASGDATSLDSSPADVVPVVGLGASAGGLVALEQFFAHVPPDPGVAFVVVTHQHPDHPSLLHELLGRKTAMPVHRLEDEVCTIEPGHVYVAPPGRVLEILGNRLHVRERGSRVPLFLPIDIFFRSLAEDRKDRAVGIILSGTGADGTLGIKEIKAQLGMVMVQEERNATYAGMPHSAIQTGVVDYVLPWVPQAELETSKEEMQSLNEELQTVNAELYGEIEELSRANDDMKNLLNGTDIATVFLDNQLNMIVTGTAFGRRATVGQSDADLFPPAEAQRLSALERSVLETGAPRREAVKLTVDGVERTYDIYLQPLRNDGEGATELASIATDVSTRTYAP